MTMPHEGVHAIVGHAPARHASTRPTAESAARHLAARAVAAVAAAAEKSSSRRVAGQVVAGLRPTLRAKASWESPHKPFTRQRRFGAPGAAAKNEAQESVQATPL